MTVLSAPKTATPVASVAEVASEHESLSIIDVRSERDYLAGHVPGAINLPLAHFSLENSSPAEMTLIGHTVQTLLAARGVGPADRIVIIDDGVVTSSAALFLCELAGANNVRVLDGGMRNWKIETRMLSIESAPLVPGGTDWNVDVNLSGIATLDDIVLASRVPGKARLVDARSQLEHEGIVGSPCCKAIGHIPGSLHMEWSTLLSTTGEFLSAERVTAIAESIGLERDEQIIVYCHTGTRSSVNGVALRAAGFTNVRNSFGSWHEWAHRDLPVAPER